MSSEGTPLHGDRGVWNVMDFDTEHAKDIMDSTLRRHLPLPGAAGGYARSDGTDWQRVNSIALADLADYSAGFIIVGGAADWEAAPFDWDTLSAGAGADMVHGHTSDAEGGTLSLACLPDLATTYLKLDASNDPVTGALDINIENTAAGGDAGLQAFIYQTDGTGMTGTLRGGYFTASGGNTANTGTIRGAEIKARAGRPGETGNDVAVLEGFSVSSDAKTYDVTIHRGGEIILDGGAGTSTLAVGLRIANNFQANRATTSYGLQIYRDSFDYTADIQLSHGHTIADGASYITLNTNLAVSGLGAGAVQSSTSGLLSSGPLPLTELASYTQGDLIYGGAADWQDLAHPGVANCVLQSTAAEVGWSANAVTFPTAGAVPVGSGANAQVAYWTAASALAGDAGLTYNAATDTLSLANSLTFTGATGVNDITVPDNLASALHLSDAGGLEYLRIVSTNAGPAVVVNDGGADIDLRVEAAGQANAFVLRGSEGNIAIGAAPVTAYKTYLYWETTSVASRHMLFADLYLDPSANTAGYYYGLDLRVQVKDANVRDVTGYLAGIRGVVRHVGDGTISWVYGALFQVGIHGASAGGVITNAAGFFVSSAYNLGAGSSITTNYGVYVAAQSAGVTNYALYTNAGTVHLGDKTSIGGTVAPLAQLHVDQSSTTAAIPALILDQADTSEGTINFIASDRGIITGATDSLASVRVEIGGVVRRLALYVDA